MSSLRAAMTNLASQVVRRDQLKHHTRMCEERLGTAQVELSKAEEEVQKIGMVMARLRTICLFPDKYDEHWDDPGGYRSRLGEFIASADELHQPLALQDRPRSESRSTLRSVDSENSDECLPDRRH